MRFLLDENLPAILELIPALDGAIHVADSAHRGKTDVELWELAVAEQRVLITRDLDFPLQNVSAYPPGLVILRPAPGSKADDILHLLLRVFDRLKAEDLFGKITVIEPGRIRQRRFGPSKS